MALHVEGPKLEGIQCSGDNQTLEVTEIYYIKGTEAEWTSENANKRTWPLIAQFYSGIPAYGDAHPYDASLVVSRKLCVAQSPTQYYVTVQYGLFNSTLVPSDTQPCEVSYGQTTVSLEVNTDVNGDLMLVEYTPPGGDLITVVGTATIEVNCPVISFSRLEAGDPLQKNLDYAMKINSDSFFGFGAKTWMCLSVTGEPRGENYWVSYIFQLSPFAAGFQSKQVYIDPETNLPPTDITDGNGIFYFDQYQTANFGALNINV